ncbi:MAG: dTMP kinase [Nocardiopsaceae bacterium]|nr:dTMP kinase [Nocardiopsaceae bacterium]
MTGAFITIDGPGGSGKSTTVAALATSLRTDGYTVHVTAEPSTGPIGTLTRSMVNEISGHALACLVAADRYHHLDSEIRPKRAAGDIVICDRYLASTLVLQARDGLPASYLLAVNQDVDPPDLAVLLSANPEIITARLDQRGRHDRFEHDPDSARTETAMFREAAATLTSMGVPVCQVDTGLVAPEQAASQITSVLAAHCASLLGHGGRVGNNRGDRRLAG